MNKTILQEASGKTMQKLILCSMLFMLGFTQAFAADEAEEAAEERSQEATCTRASDPHRAGGGRARSQAEAKGGG